MAIGCPLEFQEKVIVISYFQQLVTINPRKLIEIALVWLLEELM